ncbi:MAG: MOSC domain-containing protein [Planctomycetes bacterium]|nr:MOSC domain-containing protein [Planctomycetota bacterium]
MDLSFRFDWWLSRIARSPKDAGRVELCVLRPARGERRIVETLALTPERGIEGDRWLVDPHRREGNQVSLMNAHVLRAIAGDDAERMALAGDNLVVDLDLTEANLPPGTVLAVGECELEITPEPHRPCRLFEKRYGVTAVKRVKRGNATGRRTRGVLARCVRGGAICTGDAIVVKRGARA